MNLLIPPRTSIRQLHWDSKTNTLTGEISETNGFGRIFNDSIDGGMTVVGAKGEVRFVITHEETDLDGDTQYWTLVPVLRDSRKAPAGIKLTIFND